MNSSRNAAVLMLVGAFAVGGGVTYAGTKFMQAQRSQQPVCAPPRNGERQQPSSTAENSYRKRFYENMGFDTAQMRKFDALIDERNKAVADVINIPRAKSDSIFAAARAASDSMLTGPRAKADSIRKAMQKKSDSIFTPAQRAKLAEQTAAMEMKRKERQEQQARCESERSQGKQPPGQKNQQPTKNKSNH